MTKCSGVCIEERMQNYCDAIVKIEGLCPSTQRCCISRDEFVPNPPKEIYIVDRSKINSTKNEFKTDVKSPGASRPTSSATSSTSSSATTTVAPLPPSTTTIDTSANSETKPSRRKPCKGTCSNTLFGYPLCDYYDESAYCTEGKICCLTDPTESVTTTTTTTIKPSTKITNTKLPVCHGVCLYRIVSALCERPNVIIQRTSTCTTNTQICCDTSSSPPSVRFIYLSRLFSIFVKKEK